MSVLALRCTLTAVMFFAGVAASLYIHTLMAPEWLRAENVPLGALPYTHASGSHPTQAVRRFTLASFEYCIDGDCTGKGARYDDEARAGCQRGSAAVRDRYRVAFAFTIMATFAAGATLLVAGYRAFAVDSTGLGAHDLMMRPTKATEPAADDMTLSTAPPTPSVVRVPGRNEYRAKLTELRDQRQAYAHRVFAALTFPAGATFLFSLIAVATAFALQGSYVNCGRSAATALAERVRAYESANGLALGEWNVRLGSSLWLLLTGFILSSISLTLLPLAAWMAGRIAVEDLEEPAEASRTPQATALEFSLPQPETPERAFVRRERSGAALIAAASTADALAESGSPSRPAARQEQLFLDSPPETEMK